MGRICWPLGAIFLASFFNLAPSQQYAERNSLPVETLPFDDVYDDYFTDGYDFNDEEDIYRWNVENFPHPIKHFRFCNRMKTSHVCDPDSILEKTQADKLDDYIKQIYLETPCICDECSSKDEGGIVIGIALLKNIFQPYNVHPSKIIRSFAMTLRSNWTLGKCDNDILIVVATTDRLSYTDVGKATSAYVSLHDAHRIFLENKSYLSDGRFFEGLSSMLGAYYNRTRGIQRPDKQGLDLGLVSGSIVGAVLVLGVMLCIIFVLYRRCQKSRKDKESSVKDPESAGLRSEGLSSSWTKRDIKVMLGATKANNTLEKTSSTAKYQPCDTDERDNALPDIDEEEIDLTLALPTTTNETLSTTLSSMNSTAASTHPVSAESNNRAPDDTAVGQSTSRPSSNSPTSSGAKSSSNEDRPLGIQNGGVRNIVNGAENVASSSSATEMLDEELTAAVEGIAQTFETFHPRPAYKGHQTAL